MRLSDQTVSRLQLPAGKTDLIVFDEKVPGFGVRLLPSGRKTWIAQYRIGGNQRRYKIGHVGKVTARQALQEAQKILAQVQLGSDPQAERSGERNLPSLEKVGERYLRALRLEVAAGNLRPRSLIEVERHIERDWQPLHRRAAHTLKKLDIAERLSEIEAESGRVTSNRARSTANAMFVWAMQEGLVDSNPVAGTKKRKETTRKRVLNADELVAVWKACNGDEHSTIVRLLILTAQRRQEVGGMAESEVQRDFKMWSLPGSRTKNGFPHLVPLPAVALALLPAPRTDRDFLFGRGDGAFSGWSRCKERLDARIASNAADGKGIAPWTLHDLRRTARTGMGSIGVAPHIAERVLNHVSARSDMEKTYDQWQYLEEKRSALDRWAAHVMDLVEGRASKIITLARG